MIEIKLSEIKDILSTYPDLDDWFYCYQTFTEEGKLKDIIGNKKFIKKNKIRILIYNKIDPTFCGFIEDGGWFILLDESEQITKFIPIIPKNEEKIFTKTQKLAIEVIRDLINKNKKR